MKTYNKQEIKDLLKDNFPEEFDSYKDFYVFRNYRFDYIDGPDPGLNGLHACLISAEDKIYYSGTDGISYDLLCDFYRDDNDDFIVIPAKEFKEYFAEIRNFCSDDFMKKAEVEVDFDEEEIKIFTDSDEARFNFDFSPLNDLAEYIEKKDLCWAKRKVQEHIENNFEFKDFNSYQYATRSWADGIIEVKGIEYKVRLDRTGNCFNGGFRIE